jgi:hypothetical protein
MRAMVELLIAAIEKVEQDDAYGEAFEAAAAERSAEEGAFRRSAARTAGRRWRDD